MTSHRKSSWWITISLLVLSWCRCDGAKYPQLPEREDYRTTPFPESVRRDAVHRVRSMFDFSMDSYLSIAFPHDELKPVSGSFTDSLPELGNAAKDDESEYEGLALTLIDALDSLLLFNRTDLFIAAHRYLSSPAFPGFDVDVRVHVFESNIRMLGGLLSAHCLCSHPLWRRRLFGHRTDFEYDDELLVLAKDLGEFGSSENIENDGRFQTVHFTVDSMV